MSRQGWPATVSRFFSSSSATEWRATLRRGSSRSREQPLYRRLAMVRLSSWLSSAALALAVAAWCRADETPGWPQFRGPGGQGTAPEGMKFPVSFGPDRNVLWKTPLPPGLSSPVVWGERLFLTGFDAGAKKLETL